MPPEKRPIQILDTQTGTDSEKNLGGIKSHAQREKMCFTPSSLRKFLPHLEFDKGEGGENLLGGEGVADFFLCVIFFWL